MSKIHPVIIVTNHIIYRNKYRRINETNLLSSLGICLGCVER